MKHRNAVTSIALALVAAVGLAACEPQETYPVSNEQCGPDDAVQTLDASDCPQIPASAGF